jgi:hypothetical protein
VGAVLFLVTSAYALRMPGGPPVPPAARAQGVGAG